MSYPGKITGEEAFAARSLMTPLSFEEKWLHDLFESKENIPPEPTLQKSETLEEGEVLGERSPSASVLRSQASSTLYSIPQWQPPRSARHETTFASRKGRLSPYQLPDTNHSFWQDPRLRRVGGTPRARPVDDRQSYRPLDVTNTHVALPISSPIPDIQQLDKLDQRIGIRPRGKTSAEVQSVLVPNFIPPFPHAMLVITHQFMVANKFVSPRQHLGDAEKRNLWKSLLVRLDLHESDDLLLGKKRLKTATLKLNVYVDDLSREWLAAGIYTRPSKQLPPAFHICTQAWLKRDWDGVITLPTRPTAMETAMHRTSVQSEHTNMKNKERVPSTSPLVSGQSTHVRAGM